MNKLTFLLRTMCLEMFGDDLTTVRKVIPYTGLKLWLTIWLLRRVIRQETWGHGIGRHTPDEVWSIATADLTAISDFLGKAKLQDVDKIFLYIRRSHGRGGFRDWQRPRGLRSYAFDA